VFPCSSLDTRSVNSLDITSNIFMELCRMSVGLKFVLL